MKLILGSDMSFLVKYGYDLTGIPKADLRIGYVTTGIKGARTKEFFENVERQIVESGYTFEVFDIEGKSAEEMRSFFSDKNVIHIEGGNTFYLLKAIRETCFAEVLDELLKEGKVYIGTSAGSYIMCPSIEVADWDETGKSRFGMTDFTALNYVPFVLKVHYKDEKEETVREKMKTVHFPLRLLRDGQGILVDNGKSTFIGDGEETVL
ncbi:MAG: type 1 glutamine amidotransferase-like domain-containing protein [Candidatus Moranbacteria bacterium]|nr:type 1 glutamine amidotransferase-like domain-containing protein [Candidatus Moranbacteria bacterium]